MNGKPTPTIYVVDDDEPVRDSIELLLETAGFSVRSFASAAAFLARSDLATDGIILCDLHMPEMNGAELIAALRAQGRNFPIIVITGRGEPGLEERLRKFAVVAVLYKPVTEGDLFACIETAVAARPKR